MKLSSSLIIASALSINAVSAFMTLRTRTALAPETLRFMSEIPQEQSEDTEMTVLSKFSRSPLSIYLNNEMEEFLLKRPA